MHKCVYKCVHAYVCVHMYVCMYNSGLLLSNQVLSLCLHKESWFKVLAVMELRIQWGKQTFTFYEVNATVKVSMISIRKVLQRRQLLSQICKSELELLGENTGGDYYNLRMCLSTDTYTHKYIHSIQHHSSVL